LTTYFFLSFLLYLSLAHEIWTTLGADGSKGPFFVRTKDKKLNANVFSGCTDAYLCHVPVYKSNSGKDMTPAERGMLAYIYYNVNVSGYLKRGDFLLFDGEASFRTPVVKEMLRSYGITGYVIKPSSLHQLLSPCDNHFHALFKLAYYRSLSRRNSSTISGEAKLQLALQCYRAIDSTAIISMFTKCGILPTPGQDRTTTLWKLMSEGICTLERVPSHRRNLFSFLKHCDKTNNIFLCQSITTEILRSVGIMKS
jgi:hypothetical protein